MAAHDANEQYLLELINRARLDPITELVASRHSLHMLAVDQFAHGGIGDGDIGSRATSAGDQHFGLFRSSGHGGNLMNTNYSA